MGLDTGSNLSRIADPIGPVSPSDLEYLDGDHDHIECVAQEIVGEKNATSDVSNGRVPQGQLSRPALCFRSIAVKHLALNAKGPCVGVK